VNAPLISHPNRIKTPVGFR